MRSTFFIVIIVSLLTLLLGKVYFHTGLPYTHDSQNHLARFANYKIAVKEGQIPPRFAPNLMNHYGYPVFNYNYPLANILSLPFSFIKINYEITFKIISLSFLVFGLVGTRQWLAQLAFNTSTQVFGMTVFATNPYLINILYYRGNIGELLALCLFPWLFYSIEYLFGQKTLTFLTLNSYFLILIYTFFLLSHNLAVIFGLPLVLLYALLRFKTRIEFWKNFFLLFALSFLLSLWFWLPAIAEKGFVILGSGKLSNEFLLHFPDVTQLLFNEFTFGYSYPGAVDSLSFWIGGVQLVALVLATFYVVQRNHFWRGITAFSWMLLIFQLSLTIPLWQLLSFTRFIQFPWRLSLFFSLLILPLSALVWDNSSRIVKSFLLVLVITQLFTLSRLKPADYFHKTNIDYDAYSESTSTLNENLPLNFTYINLGDWQPGPSILKGVGEIQVEYWKGSDRSYHLSLKEPSVITEPTMNFLGWQTRANGNMVQYSNDEDIDGRIAYHLEAGEYQIRTRFTQWTWPRLVGNSISLVTLLGVVLIPSYKLLNKNQ